MRFVGSKRFSPVIYEKDVPHERDLFYVAPEIIPTKLKEFDSFIRMYRTDKVWWERQRKRCIEGYTVKKGCIWEGGDVLIDGVNCIVLADGSRSIPHLGITITVNADDPFYGDVYITGKHYFYLNFWKIMREDRFLGRKILANPFFTDLSFENWHIRGRMVVEAKDNGWFKARQKGMSEEEACDSSYIFLFFNDVQVAIVGGMEVYNENTFKMVKRGVYQLYNTQFFKTISKDNDGLFKTKNTGTEIHSRTAKNNAQILSGLNSLYKAHLEEIGIMAEKLARDIAEFIKPSIKVGRNRTGYITYTGTSGEFKDGVADIEKMIYSPDNYDLLTFENIYDADVEPGTRIACFIPAWKFKIQDEDGNSLKSESIKYIEEQRAEAKPEERAIKIAAEPITTNEMFNITTGGFFGDMIQFHCNTARSYIVTHKSKQIIERGFLHMVNPVNPIEGVEWESNNDYGDVFVAEKPQRDRNGSAIPGLYGVGTDSYDFTTANTSSSKLSALVFKGYNNTLPYGEGGIYNNFVAMYLDRPSEAQGGRSVAYDNAAKLTLWYQGYNLIEYSKILIFDHFVRMGLEGYLKLRPDFAIANMVDRSEVSNRYGYPAALVPHGLKVLKDWLSNHDNIYNCPFIELLSAWAKFKVTKDYNCDNTISSMLCVVAANNDLIEMSKPSREQIENVVKTFKGYKQVNGILQAIYR